MKVTSIEPDCVAAAALTREAEDSRRGSGQDSSARRRQQAGCTALVHSCCRPVVLMARSHAAARQTVKLAATRSTVAAGS